MAAMNDHPLARFEARIAGLVEGAFSQLFGSPTALQTVGSRLSAALDQFDAAADPLPRRVIVRLRPADLEALHRAWPGLEESLARHLAEQRALRGRTDAPPPDVLMQGDESVQEGHVVISAAPARTRRDPTGALPRVPVPSSQPPHEAILLTESGAVIPLDGSVITLGRGPDCSIVLADPYASRQHAQIRLRGQTFVLLDAGSQSGTYVNGASVSEIVLHSGDVIQLGRSVFVYQDQQQTDDVQATQPMPPRVD